MNYLLVIVFFLEIIKYIFMCKTFFNIKIKRYWIIAVTAIIFAIVVFLWPYYMEELIMLILLFIFFDLFLIMDSKIKKRITAVIKISFIGTCMDGISGRILRIISGTNSGFENKPFFIILNNVITIFILLLIYIIKKRYKVKYDGFLKIIAYLCAIIMGVPIIFAILDTEENIKNAGNTDYIFSNILIIIYYLSLMTIVLFILYVNNMNRKMKRLLETEHLLKETQKNYYEAMLEKEVSTRSFRHDMINHLVYLKNLMEKNQQEFALNYIEDLQKGMSKIQQKCYDVGNDVIDAMLNYYLSLLKEDVSVTVSGYCEKEIDMSQVDLCVVFSNLIKNAVESLNCQKEREKYFKIMFHSGKDNIKIEILNSMEKDNIEEKKENMLPETTKKDKKNHGIGLRNVKEAVKENHGLFEWEHHENSFMVQVILPCKKEKKEEKCNV